MEKISYPITTGVPSLAVIGVSGAGKSSLLSKTIAREVNSHLDIIGTEQAQTTLIPTEYFLQSGLNPQTPKLRVTCRNFGCDVPQLDIDAVFTALIQPLLSHLDNSKKSEGIRISLLKEYASSGNFVEVLLRATNGAVRLEQLDSPTFRDLTATSAQELLDAVDCSAIDASTAKVNGDSDKKRARRVALRDALQQCWDDCSKDSSSSVSRFLSHISEVTWNQLKTLIPDEMWEGQIASIRLDMNEKSDQQRLRALLSPSSPLSLIVEKFEIYCAMHKIFQDFFKHNEKNPWIDPKLPFRLILCDTAGLTQDVEDDAISIRQRLSATVVKGRSGILLMMPRSTRDDRLRTILQCFRTEAGLKRDKIPVYLAISCADEALSFSVDIEEDENAFREEFLEKWKELEKLKGDWQDAFGAVEARYITNQPKKLKAYIDDMKRADFEHGSEVERSISMEASYSYLYDIAKELQKGLFPQDTQTPIFVKLARPITDDCLVRLHVFDAEYVKSAAQTLAEISTANYFILERLHGNTARAFWKHHSQNGDKFVSRAERYGRIHVHIDGDVRRALGSITICPLQNPNRQIDLRDIVLDDEDGATTLFDRLGLPCGASEETVKRGLWQLFLDNFGEKTSAGFSRVLTQAVRRISYKDQAINVMDIYNRGCRTDFNQGVADVLEFYRGYFSSEQIAPNIAETLNDEFSKAFSRFFFALYSDL